MLIIFIFNFYILDGHCVVLVICSHSLRASLQNLERISMSLLGRRNHATPERTDEFDCTLCLKLLYEPITTPCGHSFCRSCLFQSMDRSENLAFINLSFYDICILALFSSNLCIEMLGNKCPLCRTVLFVSPRTCSIRWVANDNWNANLNGLTLEYSFSPTIAMWNLAC